MGAPKGLREGINCCLAHATSGEAVSFQLNDNGLEWFGVDNVRLVSAHLCGVLLLARGGLCQRCLLVLLLEVLGAQFHALQACFPTPSQAPRCVLPASPTACADPVCAPIQPARTLLAAERLPNSARYANCGLP
eukprot:1178639-Prorocentrum_minimum.AAC.3